MVPHHFCFSHSPFCSELATFPRCRAGLRSERAAPCFVGTRSRRQLVCRCAVIGVFRPPMSWRENPDELLNVSSVLASSRSDDVTIPARRPVASPWSADCWSYSFPVPTFLFSGAHSRFSDVSSCLMAWRSGSLQPPPSLCLCL